ncbi:MAG: imidazole glycerol phosphate synthase subunit HisH [Dongiaceae bacterium]
MPGGGENVNCVLFALERLGARHSLTLDPGEIASAERVILMGVGAAPPAMAKLHRLGLVDCLHRLTQPLLGICVGMQLLFERSAEGDVACLGILPGRIARLPDMPGLTVPHMGWNRLDLLDADSPLLDGLKTGDWAYYANSFYAPLSNLAIACTDYGVPLSAVVSRGNVYGCQFHPEKSRRVGARILENFLAMR